MNNTPLEYPRLLRLWHWLNFITISGILLTVILRKTFLNYRSNAPLIEGKAAAAGVVVPKELAVDIAKALRDRMWELHVILGFVFAGLLLLRLIAFFTGSASQSAGRFSHQERRLLRPAYLVFYAFAGFLAVTGLLLAWQAQLGLAKNLKGLIKEFHELALWGIVAFAILHLAGVLRAEWGERTRGLISRMISGR